MSKLAIFVSATIVLIFSSPGWSSPQETVPDEKPLEENFGPPQELDENMSIVDAPAVDVTTKITPPRYYPYRQQLTFRVGQISDNSKTFWKDVVLGFQYLFPKFLSPKLEAGADMLPDGKGHLYAGVRWIHFERDYLRPGYKISLDHKADAEKRLATFSDIDQYYLRFSATLEYVFWNPYSVRLEPEIISSLKESQWLITLGLSRGW